MSPALSHRLAPLALLAVVVALLPLALTNNFLLNIAIVAGFNAIVCVGLNLLIGFAGQISLGHAGFFGLGAYASAVLVSRYGWPPLAALLAGAVAVGLLAFAVAKPILRLKGHYLAMATLGIGIIISIVLKTETRITGGPDGLIACRRRADQPRTPASAARSTRCDHRRLGARRSRPRAPSARTGAPARNRAAAGPGHRR